jgi:hypothetical protein
MYFWDRLWAWLWVYLRPVLKGVLRRTTGLCELQRVCYSTEKGAERALRVEHSLDMSKSRVVAKIRERLTLLADEGRFNHENRQQVAHLVECAVEAICTEKQIKPDVHREFLFGLRICFLQVYGYKQLVVEVDTMRRITYDSENAQHEELLLFLWKQLMPGVPLTSRVTKQWTQIGFQGEDPKTDFRGMGILGLRHLVYLATEYPDSARNMLLHSNHPVHGFPFAITGINLTYLAYTLLIEGKLKTHFYNSFFGTMAIDDFHKVYCYIYDSFDKFWIREKPKDVMEFRFIRDKFVDELVLRLSDPKTSLKLCPVVETI